MPSPRLARPLLALSLALLACRADAPPQPPAAPAPAPAPAVTARPVTVILTRHAEKASDDPRDPSLSPAGQARARGLAALLREAGVTHLFASEFRRTQETLRPLAEAAGLQVVPFPAADPEALLAALRTLPAGAVAVVAGHSNTVPALARALGGAARGLDGAGNLPDDAYDRLLVVTVPAGAGAESVQTLELRYVPAAAP